MLSIEVVLFGAAPNEFPPFVERLIDEAPCGLVQPLGRRFWIQSISIDDVAVVNEKFI
jgi:hypothetical protein